MTARVVGFSNGGHVQRKTSTHKVDGRPDSGHREQLDVGSTQPIWRWPMFNSVANMMMIPQFFVLLAKVYNPPICCK